MAKLIGRGVYTLAEAERLIDVPARRIARWTQGYSFVRRGKLRTSPPLIAADTQAGTLILSFADILEVRFLDAFLGAGVSIHTVRRASVHAREFLGRQYPFSTRLFKTDGRTILTEVVRGASDRILLDIVKNQYEFARIVSPMLYHGIDFNQLDEPARWWPVGKSRKVLLDPTRAFGAPISSERGVPTRVLSDSVSANNNSVEFVAECFEVSKKAVRDAVYFEKRLAA